MENINILLESATLCFLARHLIKYVEGNENRKYAKVNKSLNHIQCNRNASAIATAHDAHCNIFLQHMCRGILTVITNENIVGSDFS